MKEKKSSQLRHYNAYHMLIGKKPGQGSSLFQKGRGSQHRTTISPHSNALWIDRSEKGGSTPHGPWIRHWKLRSKWDRSQLFIFSICFSCTFTFQFYWNLPLYTFLAITVPGENIPIYYIDHALHLKIQLLFTQ